jgi:DNA-binding transcriptional MerR regulator
MSLTVSTVGAAVGLSADTVRYYERLGLLPAPERTAAGHRQYDQAAIERLRLIKSAQRVGLRLREIGELLAICDQGLCPCGHAEALLRGRMAGIDARLAELGAVRAELARVVARYPAAVCHDQTASGWRHTDGAKRAKPRAVLARDPAPLRYVGVPPASRLGRARTPHVGMPLGMWAPGPAGR